MKYALVINKDNMGVGGIETNIIDLIESLSKYFTIEFYWFTDNPSLLDPIFKEIFDKCNVHTVVTHKKIHWFKFKNQHVPKYDKVILMSFGLYDYARNESIKKIFKESNEIANTIFIPHYKLKDCFLEKEYGASKKSIAYKLSRKIYQYLFNNNSVFFFSTKHILEVEKNYDLKFDTPDKLVFKRAETGIPEFDEKLVKYRFSDGVFRIITISRFDFPHKGYLLGLIDSFSRFRAVHENSELDIIGYGQDENILKKKISEQDEATKQSIILLGKIAPNDLKKYIQRADVNISLAGSVAQGAINGVISLPVRHYCYDCETYGFLPGSINKIVSDDPGEPIYNYLEEIYNFNETEYIKYSLDSYSTYAETRKEQTDRDFILNIRNKTTSDMPLYLKMFVVFTNYFIKIIHVIHRITGKSNRNDAY